MTTPATDPFLYDTDTLSQLTSDPLYRQGLKYVKNDHVMEVYEDGRQLFALIEENQADMPYQVVLSHSQQAGLEVECDCGSSQDQLCQHAVAALLSYRNQQQQDHGYLSAMETAIQDRIKRGQTEVKVRQLGSHPWFGAWQASSVLASTPWQRSYQVQIRSLQERTNCCSCPDFAVNQLGTCKHIEAVLHKIRKRLSTRQQQQPAPMPFVYLSWQDGPTIWVQRTADMDADLARIIDSYFDAEGKFSAALPEGFFRFSDALYGSDQLLIGDDARQAVQRLATEQSHRLKAQEIHRQIMRCGGQLPGINARLYPYQIEGVAFLAANGRTLLADDMGLGKTLQAIAAASWLAAESGVRRTLIICPASLKQQWAREIAKFTGQETQVIQGGANEREAQYRQDKTFFVINYELVLRDLNIINDRLLPDLIILDEAQRIKNWRTKLASTIKQISSKYAFVLSGTPLENRLEDLYSLMQVVDQQILGPLWRYLNDFHIRDEKGKVLGYRNLSELRRRIAPVMLRRNRSVVSQQLPSRSTLRLDVAMTPAQQELHGSAMSAASQLASIARKRPLTPSESNRLMAALQQARMACDAAGLVDKTTEGSPKLKELKTLVEELCIAGGQKMVVFSQWHGMTSMIEQLLAKMGVGHVHLHGGVPSHKRGVLMDAFAQDDAVSVFISTDAGGTGLNLQAATVLVNMDIPWNPAVLEQRNARVHRLGQTNKVQIILMIAEDSYEARVYQLVNNKQNLFDNVIDPEADQDVVGVSKKVLATLVDELNQRESTGQRPAEEPEVAAEETQPQTPPTEQQPVTATVIQPDTTAEDTALNQGIATLQDRFGQRIEQILAKGRGLLVVLDTVTPADEQFTDQLALPVSVALIDRHTLKQLQRLGVDSPLHDAEPVPTELGTPAENPWLTQASKNLHAARLLLEQEMDAGVLELLCGATAALITNIADLPQRMPVEQIGVWLYSEALPRELVNDAQATRISRMLGLRAAPQIPLSLLQQVYQDTEQMLAAYPDN